MDALEYCRQKVAPEGSSLYYALLFAPQAQKPALTALAAYRAELLEIPHEVSEAGVGAVKLNWWQEELGRLREGQPRHPVTQALEASLPGELLASDALDGVIEACRMDLEYGRYPTLRELTLYCHRAGGGIADMAWRLGDEAGADAAPFAHDLSMGLELTRIIRHLRRDLLAGRVYIPEDELLAAGLSVETLMSEEAESARTALIGRQAERARRFLDNAIAQLSDNGRRNQRYGLILAVLYRDWLDRLAQDGYPILERQQHLTPLRKLFAAWRTAWRPRSVKPGPKETTS